jgi:integrase
MLRMHRKQVDQRAAAAGTAVRDELGFDGLTLHGLRPFAATQLAARGDVPARRLAGRLGSADAAVAMHTYAAFFPVADVELSRVLAAA